MSSEFELSLAVTILNKLKPESQLYKILSHIMRLGSITQVEAHELYRVYRLASRINDLKNLGLVFVKNQKVDLTGTRYVEYSLS